MCGFDSCYPCISILKKIFSYKKFSTYKKNNISTPYKQDNNVKNKKKFSFRERKIRRMLRKKKATSAIYNVRKLKAKHNLRLYVFNLYVFKKIFPKEMKLFQLSKLFHKIKKPSRRKF